MNRDAVASDLGWPEGPAVLDDGRVAFVETYRSQVSTWSPDAGHARLADVGGGPNAVALGDDGCLYVCQNGGVVGPWRAAEQRPPSIQRISSDAAVEIIAVEIDGVGFQAPNDLAFGRDGDLYFTDPGRYDDDTRPDPGYIFVLHPDGSGEVLAELGAVYPNGIVAQTDGAVVWVESYTRSVVRRDGGGSVETLATLDEGHVPDGLAIAGNGDFYITTVTSGGLDVVDREGGVKDFIEVGTVPTNCAFDGERLFVTDGGAAGESTTVNLGGVLWALDVGIAGQPLFRGGVTA